MVEILTLSSPHNLFKNLGALSEYAKCSESWKQNQKYFEILNSVVVWYGQKRHLTLLSL